MAETSQKLFDPNKPVPQDVIDAMLGVSTVKEESADLDKQLALARQLAHDAATMQYKGAKGKAGTIGGLAHASGRGLMGYMAGERIATDREKRAELIKRQQGAIGSIYGLSNSPMPDMSSPTMQAPFNPMAQDPFQ